MRHNTTDILNRLTQLAEKLPFDKPEHDETERLMKEFEVAILQKLTKSDTLEFTIRLFALNEPLNRKHEEI